MLHGGPGASHDYLRPQLDALAEPGAPPALLLRPARRRPLAARRRHAARHAGRTTSPISKRCGAPRLEQLTLVGYSWGALLGDALRARASGARSRAGADLARARRRPRAHAEMRARLAAARRAPGGARPSRRALDLSDRRARFALAVAGYFVDPRARARADAVSGSAARRRGGVAQPGRLRSLPRLCVLCRCRRWCSTATRTPSRIATAQSRPRRRSRPSSSSCPRCGHVALRRGARAAFAALRRFSR